MHTPSWIVDGVCVTLTAAARRAWSRQGSPHLGRAISSLPVNEVLLGTGPVIITLPTGGHGLCEVVPDAEPCRVFGDINGDGRLWPMTEKPPTITSNATFILAPARYAREVRILAAYWGNATPRHPTDCRGSDRDASLAFWNANKFSSSHDAWRGRVDTTWDSIIRGAV